MEEFIGKKVVIKVAFAISSSQYYASTSIPETCEGEVQKIQDDFIFLLEKTKKGGLMSKTNSSIQRKAINKKYIISIAEVEE